MAATGARERRSARGAPRAFAPVANRDASRCTAPSGRPADARWLAAGVLGLSGFASLMHEIAWTRILALVLGPTTYAFAATLAAVIGGVAIGSGGGIVDGEPRAPASGVAGHRAGPGGDDHQLHLLAGRTADPVARGGADGERRRTLRAVAAPRAVADRRPDPAHRHLPGRGVSAGAGVDRPAPPKASPAASAWSTPSTPSARCRARSPRASCSFRGSACRSRCRW